MSIVNDKKYDKTISTNGKTDTRQILDSLFDLAALLSHQDDFDEILRLVSSRASELFKVKLASIIMINPQTQKTIKTIIRDGKKTDTNHHAFVQNNIVGWAIKNDQSFVSNNIKKDNRFKKQLFEESEIHSVMCAPIKTENTHIGYLVLMDKLKNKNFNDELLTILEKYVLICAPYLNKLQKIEEFFKTPIPEDTLLTKYETIGLFGKSKKYIELLKSIESAAKCDVRVLLDGQSGTGKELIAKAIHNLSSRVSNPFIAIDCGAIPENLIESELFGHVKGTFTGATTDRKGLFQEADMGTLYIDEIENLPINMQAKLLRVLQENEIRALGSNKSVKVNVRVIAASSTPLKSMVENQKFREDLFYRLHVYPIYVPTLNDRREDIPLLADIFLKKYSSQQGKKIEHFHRSILDYFYTKNWEGNIRELENFIERLVTLSPQEKKFFEIRDLPNEIQKEIKKLTQTPDTYIENKPLQDSVDEFEENIIRKTLKDNNWNQSKAARILNISEGTIRLKIKRLGINKSD
jgi:Nif-specific regulatory protein